jgi:hypothetical protein
MPVVGGLHPVICLDPPSTLRDIDVEIPGRLFNLFSLFVTSLTDLMIQNQCVWSVHFPRQRKRADQSGDLETLHFPLSLGMLAP